MSKERFFSPSFHPYVFAQLYKSLNNLSWSLNSSLIWEVFTKVLSNLSYPVTLWVTLNVFPEYLKNIFLSTEDWVRVIWAFIREVWKMLEFRFHCLVWVLVCVSWGFLNFLVWFLGFLKYFLFTLGMLWFVRSGYHAGELMWYIVSVSNLSFMHKPQSCNCKKGTTTSRQRYLTLFWKS